ncbi:Transcriptional regulator ATRX, partial [Brachionus plicatilis]
SSEPANLVQVNSETNLGPISPRSPSIISQKYNLVEENPLLTEEEALAKLMQMAKEDGFPIDHLNDDSFQQEELDLTLQPDDQDTSPKQVKECSVKIDRIDLDLLKKHKISSTTLDFLAEKKILTESLAIERLCKLNFGKVSNSARKRTTSRRKSLRPRKNAPSVTSFSDTDSEPVDTENSDFTAEKTDDEYRDKLVDMMHSDNFEITEDDSESMLSSDSEDKCAARKQNKWTSEDFSDSSKTSVCPSEASDVKLIESVAHEYRDSKQTPGYPKQNFDMPNLNLSDEEKENKIPGNEESEEEIRPRPTRRSKRLSSECSEEREMSREEDALEMELSKKSTHLKGILGGELQNEILDQDKEDLISLENDSASSDEIKPIIKKRKRPIGNSDSESSIKSKLRSRSVVKKESKCDEDDEESSESDDSDIQSVHSSEEESPTKQETRHKLRNIIHDGKLTKETQDAIQTERERKKRIEEKRALEASIAKDNENDLYLDVDQASKKMLVKVDGAISKKLKPHQIEGIKFMWDSCFESCEMIKNGHKGSGCLLAHCMGLGKTFQVIALVHTLLTNRDLTKCKRVLVLLPVNVLTNWKNEFRKWTRPCQKQITVYLLPNEKGFSSDLARARFNEIESWHRRGI